MIEGLFNQVSYVASKKMLDVTTLRHEALASNLANLETPHYRRVDLNPSFPNELRQAIESHDAQQIASVQPALAADASAVGIRKDGNTVVLESELMKMNQNYLEHQLETQLVSGTLLKLRLAITGRGT